MSEPVWNKFLTERDKEVFAAAGYGARAGFGNRPALLVIDVSYAFCGDRPEPILESIRKWRNSCGEDAWVALKYIRALIDKAHEKGLPVIYTTGVRRDDNWDSGSWSWDLLEAALARSVIQTERTIAGCWVRTALFTARTQGMKVRAQEGFRLRVG